MWKYNRKENFKRARLTNFKMKYNNLQNKYKIKKCKIKIFILI